MDVDDFHRTTFCRGERPSAIHFPGVFALRVLAEERRRTDCGEFWQVALDADGKLVPPRAGYVTRRLKSTAREVAIATAFVGIYPLLPRGSPIQVSTPPETLPAHGTCALHAARTSARPCPDSTPSPGLRVLGDLLLAPRARRAAPALRGRLRRRPGGADAPPVLALTGRLRLLGPPLEHHCPPLPAVRCPLLARSVARLRVPVLGLTGQRRGRRLYFSPVLARTGSRGAATLASFAGSALLHEVLVWRISQSCAPAREAAVRGMLGHQTLFFISQGFLCLPQPELRLQGTACKLSFSLGARSLLWPAFSPNTCPESAPLPCFLNLRS